MIDTITIKNFKSILDLALDLRYGEGKAPNGWKSSNWLPFVGDEAAGRFVPVLAIYGANASGKSNILSALLVLQKVLSQGIEDNYYPNRLLNTKKTSPTEFLVAKHINGNEYRYEIAYNGNSIQKEELSCIKNDGQVYRLFSIENGQLMESGFQNILYPPSKLQEICRVECQNSKGNQTQSFMGRIYKGYAGLSNELNDMFVEIVENNQVHTGNDILLSQAIDQLVKSGIAFDSQDAFNKIIPYLKKLDINISDMKLERQEIRRNEISIQWERLDSLDEIRMQLPGDYTVTKNREGQLYVERITSYHQREDGGLEAFNFNSEESQGTKLLAGLLGIVLDALETGKRLFIDELDRSLHPLLLIQIVRMFKSKKLNKRSAQLIFTLHETTLLEDPTLRLSEVAILNSSVYSGTTLARLIDYHNQEQSVRNIHNFRKRYLEGIYAGIPDPIL